MGIQEVLESRFQEGDSLFGKREPYIREILRDGVLFDEGELEFSPDRLQDVLAGRLEVETEETLRAELEKLLQQLDELETGMRERGLDPDAVEFIMTPDLWDYLGFNSDQIGADVDRAAEDLRDYTHICLEQERLTPGIQWSLEGDTSHQLVIDPYNATLFAYDELAFYRMDRENKTAARLLEVDNPINLGSDSPRVLAEKFGHHWLTALREPDEIWEKSIEDTLLDDEDLSGLSVEL